MEAKKEVLAELISKEIELTMNNTYSVRMKFIFTVWIGPFILLGAFIIASKAKIVVAAEIQTWLVAGIASVFYFLLGAVAGQYEKGNWKRCDELRLLFATITGLEAEYHDRLLDRRNQKDVVWTYMLMFFLLWVIFACCVFFAVEFGSLETPPT